MILSEYNRHRQLKFICISHKLVGLQINDGKFRYFRNCDLHYNIHSVELKAFYGSCLYGGGFLINFKGKKLYIL